MVCLGSCSAGDQSHPSGADGGRPALLLVDSIILQEADSLFLGYPEKVFTVGADGDIFIADEFMNHVLRFGQDGNFKLRYGRAGEGPGEFRGTLSFTMVTDSVVVQGTPSKLVGYARGNGDFRFNQSHRRGFPASWAVVGDSLVLGLFDFTAKKAVALVAASQLGQGESGAPAPPLVPDRVDFPPEYIAHPDLQMFSTAYAVAWADSMVVGFSGVPYVVRYTLHGTPVDTAWIPSTTRRGFPEGWLDVFAAGRNPSLQEIVGAFSFLSGIWRLPDGNFLLWHQENAVDESQREPKFSGTPHLSVLSADLRRACVDAPVEFPGTELPRFAVHGDTVYALDQVGLVGGAGVSSVVRRYVVSTRDCRWRPTLRPRSAARK